ncbi:ABC transporter substrate-binding protein [Bradyrhizobium erythrophlei]|uniref:Putative ABC transport system substrate-binding protein n=1 Tax=Bradyrhizobium erythrophlei TaxID=1437360 RepID=A0A1M5Y7G4_9BRAD|nr:ABC transporter substrate-binding protein [Bradyrhizobium erythrophlei]SHI07748.1 putative ABC transport system substrate-binding protein [Bradyrhizobium erythrophlei]
MKRREFIALLGGAAAWPLSARAEPAMPTIGYIGSETPELFADRLDAFRQGLAAAGYEEGRNVRIEFRWAEGRNDRFPALAADLVSRQVALIAAPGSTPAALAAKEATATIPIVFAIGGDPVSLDLVASLSRPRGNVTGATSLNVEVGPKRLELLQELVPGARIVGLLVNPTNPKLAEAQSRDGEAAARSYGVQIHVLRASSESEFEPDFAALAPLGAGALVIGNDALFLSESRRLATLAIRYAMPTIHQSRAFAAAGGLASYGGSVAEAHRNAGVYAGRILKGERPADLPVVQSTKIELTVNLRAAKALGLAVPELLLARADEVIE